MLSIEEYICERKKEDKLNEFDLKLRKENLEKCLDYVTDYYNFYLIASGKPEDIEKAKKLERYRKVLEDYQPETREWAVDIYNKYGNMIDRHLRKLLYDKYFFLYSDDDEFRDATYDLHSELIEKMPHLRNQENMLFLMVKEYHLLRSKRVYNIGFPEISKEIDLWIKETWEEYKVYLPAFAFNCVRIFFYNPQTWPVEHKIKNEDSIFGYDYNYKKRNNLFNIDTLYKEMPKKPFTIDKKRIRNIVNVLLDS